MEDAECADNQVKVRAGKAHLACKRGQRQLVARIAIQQYHAFAMCPGKGKQPVSGAGMPRHSPDPAYIIAGQQRRTECQADTSAGATYQHVGIVR
ncbi:hypothetical protein D3C79_831460 [compost metagenome]